MTAIDRPARPGTPYAPIKRRGTNWYAAFWRWHFYGSIIVIPVLFLLAVSGMTYMFRSQVDAFTHPGVLTVTQPQGTVRVPLSAQESVVRAAFPDRTVLSLVDATGDRSTIFVTELVDGSSSNVYVDPYTATVTGDLTSDQLVSDWAERVHGDLLLGDEGIGDRIVELGASWAIVLSISGFIIFFLGRRPRKAGRNKNVTGSRIRGMHAIAGVPVGLGILMLVVSGLPWTGVWGTLAQQVATDTSASLWGEDPGADSTIRDLMEKTNGTSAEAGWAIGNGPLGASAGGGTPISIDIAVAAATAAGAPEPYSVMYPDGDTGVFSVTGGQWDNNGNAAESDVTQEQTVHVDQYSGAIAARYGYDDYSAVAKVVSQGIAVHEGRRFGAVNMIATTLFCLAVIFMCVSGPIMWWTRRGTASGTAAPRAKLPVWGHRVLLVAMTALGIFLPMFGLSLLIVLALDQLLIRRVPRLRRFFRTA
ncbi:MULTISPECIES: PepSY domain-containing protein [unclassified Cryobacterium]|uniref:PepSY-associated TM helix domain-containing protein n=1 Tax=unclassified Cryobacterium TaxID=2649013 RepID=UPI00106919E5|nr:MULTISPECIES: PepSY domain-containing protein [unclassified Cryobacterium]TFC57494.1 PepSY domain-containing protein [Cryobacterium sp. TMB1-7]TFC90017.1 PepSY domain-containing protein [Cryobacterium sp. TMT4-31]